jgi:hypothetical protein
MPHLFKFLQGFPENPIERNKSNYFLIKTNRLVLNFKAVFKFLKRAKWIEDTKKHIWSKTIENFSSGKEEEFSSRQSIVISINTLSFPSRTTADFYSKLFENHSAFSYV